jgi:twitching motility protein PilT
MPDMRIDDILREAVDLKASDLMLSVGSPITFHIFGALQTPDPDHIVTSEESAQLVHQLMNEQQRQRFEENWELDMGYHLKGVARFRASIMRQRGALGAVLRVIPLSVPHYAEIGIPKRLLVQLLSVPNGLILVTGPTGAGKSTTVASIIQYLNTEHGVPRHIVTIEDPIEYFFEPNLCVIDQREIGTDTKGYVQGLKAALRQMPHIIFVGEMRDRETMEIALTAAETGNIVISTLSTQSASKTINRIIDVFPLHDQAEIRTRLALSLQAVISQVLLPRRDTPGRIAAREIMLVDNSISNQIREGKIHQINNTIAAGFNKGMILLDDSLLQLHKEGVLHTADVLSRLSDSEKARLVMS